MKIIDDEINAKVEMELWHEKFIFEKKDVTYFEIGEYIYSIADHYPCPTYFDGVKKHKIENCYYTGYFEYLTHIGKKEYICNGHVSLLNSPYTPYFANEQEAIAALEQVNQKRQELISKYEDAPEIFDESKICSINTGEVVFVIGNKKLNILWSEPQVYFVSNIDNNLITLSHQNNDGNIISVSLEELLDDDSLYFNDINKARMAIKIRLDEISKKTSIDMTRRLSKSG